MEEHEILRKKNRLRKKDKRVKGKTKSTLARQLQHLKTLDSRKKTKAKVKIEIQTKK